MDDFDEVQQLEVGAVIASTGADEINTPEMGQYGLERYTNVLTNIQAERLLSSTGPNGGQLLRPSDNKPPQSVAILQCVGSREPARPARTLSPGVRSQCSRCRRWLGVHVMSPRTKSRQVAHL